MICGQIYLDPGSNGEWDEEWGAVSYILLSYSHIFKGFPQILKSLLNFDATCETLQNHPLILNINTSSHIRFRVYPPLGNTYL